MLLLLLLLMLPPRRMLNKKVSGTEQAAVSMDVDPAAAFPPPSATGSKSAADAFESSDSFDSSEADEADEAPSESQAFLSLRLRPVTTMRTDRRPCIYKHSASYWLRVPKPPRFWPIFRRIPKLWDQVLIQARDIRRGG
jgi:hypothetical protein